MLLFSRNGIFQARFYKGDRSYIYKSLKTKKLDEARRLATKFFYETEYKKSEGLPLQQKSFGDVMREYTAHRQQQYDQSLQGNANASSKGQVSIHMLRQIKRVSKFLIECHGNKAVDKIGNAEIADYIPWRKDYYRKLPADQVPRNAKLNPADKTLEWETTLLKTVLKWAHDKGSIGMTANRYDEKYSLYSLRHFYAVMALRKNMSVYSIAANMGTSVQVIRKRLAMAP